MATSGDLDMSKDWHWYYGAMIGALIGTAFFLLFTMAGVTEVDTELLSSPTRLVGGGAFWGVVVVWLRNKLARRKM